MPTAALHVLPLPALANLPIPSPQRSLRLSVRTPDFQSGKTGSTPVGSARISYQRLMPVRRVAYSRLTFGDAVTTGFSAKGCASTRNATMWPVTQQHRARPVQIAADPHGCPSQPCGRTQDLRIALRPRRCATRPVVPAPPTPSGGFAGPLLAQS